MKYHILFLTNYLNYGGASKQMTAIANYMVTQGHRVSMFSYANESYDYPLDERIEYIKGESRAKANGIYHFTEFGIVRKVLKEKDPDVVISFMQNPNVMSVLCANRRAKLILSERGDPGIFSGIIYRTKVWLYRFADRLVCQTEGAKKHFTGAVFRKSVVIPNIVLYEKPERRKPEDTKKKISFVGRFEIKQKRHDIMLQAFAKVHEQHPDYELHFYGDGADENSIKEMAKDMELSESVIFHGKVSNVMKETKDSAIFAMTSDYEGISNSLIEAMVLGLPVVSTDCTPGGARFLIDDGVNGLLCKCGDATDVAEKISYLIENPNKAEVMGENAQDICDKFSIDKVGRMWESQVYEVMGDHYEENK